MYSKFYIDYLKSPKWKSIRRKKLEQVGYICEKKGKEYLPNGTIVQCSGSLQVHHLTYKHLGNELMSELIVVCEAHHKRADFSRSFKFSKQCK